MGPVLVDVRGLQGAADEAELAVLRQARPALAGRTVIGLVDPDLPPLAAPALACLDQLCANPYFARRAAPECFVRLRADAPLFSARLLVDPAIPCVVLDHRAPPGLAGAVARYWTAAADIVASPAMLWTAASSLRRGPSQPARLAVLSPTPDLPICRALRRQGADIFGPDPLPLLSPRYDSALFVMTNRPETAPLLRLLRRHGGSAVVLDSCLLAAYGPPEGLALAAEELGRSVPATDFQQWQRGIARPGALLLGEIASAADELFVHSAWLADEIGRRYGRAATTVPPVPDLPRLRAEADGLQAESCVWAVEMLRSWGRDVRLDLALPPADRPKLAALAARLGIGDLVGFAPAAASIALVLAMRGQGSSSAALAASAGLPCIAGRGVVEATEIGADIRIVPDQPSPPLLAEAILALLPDPVNADTAARRIIAALGM